MSSRMLIAGVASTWLVLAAAVGTVMGQVKGGIRGNVRVKERGSVVADFATVYECLERVTRDRGMAVIHTGSGMSWEGRANPGQAFVVFADERRFPSLGGHVLGHIVGGQPAGRVDFAAMQKIRLDPNTGQIAEAEGVGVRDIRITSLSLFVDLKRPGEDASCAVSLDHDFGNDRVDVSMTSAAPDGRAVSRELIAALKSKVKLAKRLGEARKKRQRDKDGSDRK